MPQEFQTDYSLLNPSNETRKRTLKKAVSEAHKNRPHPTRGYPGGESDVEDDAMITRATSAKLPQTEFSSSDTHRAGLEAAKKRTNQAQSMSYDAAAHSNSPALQVAKRAPVDATKGDSLHQHHTRQQTHSAGQQRLQGQAQSEFRASHNDVVAAQQRKRERAANNTHTSAAQTLKVQELNSKPL